MNEAEQVFWFRYHDTPTEDGMRVYLERLPLLRTTPKGVWLRNYVSDRFVLNDARKRFAYPTEKEALQSFIMRKKRQIGIYAARHDQAVEALAIAKDMQNGVDRSVRQTLPLFEGIFE